jgi:tetratricopeptide (TPR) repeat protein
MADLLLSRASADRLRVFISSTIGECAKERDAACAAIKGLNFEPVQFEREGARAQAPRDFYLRKLQDSHIVLSIYRKSYGWIDEAKGMSISGLEDEFREAQRLGKDFLGYVLKSAPDRDARLEAMVTEMMGGPHVLYFFEDGEDLEARFRDDLTALVTARVTKAQTASPTIGTATATLAAIFRDGALRVRRNGLLDRLSQTATLARVVWVTGASGAGKTALVAEWAHDREAAYVNARGMDARTALLAAAEQLGLASGPELATPLFDDVRSILLNRWKNGHGWPLILDDPGDADAVWSVLGTCLAQSGAGSVVIVTRDKPDEASGETLTVPGFTADELAALRILAGTEICADPGYLPVLLRKQAAAMSGVERYASLDAVSREILGYLSLAPAALTLADLQPLLGSAADTATEITERIAEMNDLLMESTAGFGFIHESLRDEIGQHVRERPQLHGLLVDRLSGRLARTGRSWAAFSLRRGDMSERVARLANRAVSEAVFSGSTRHLTDALEYLADYYRARAEKGRLVSVLMALGEARANQGRAQAAALLLAEARTAASEIADREAEEMIEILQASIDLRRSASAAALARVRALRESAHAEGRKDREGRLLLDEGVAYLSVNDTDAAAPVFRRARELFVELEDGYGTDVASRNLIASLSLSTGGREEANALRAELEVQETDSPRHRAWLCNLDVPRLRIAKRFEEAEAMAREAIAIGTDLGDAHLVAINQIMLGNVLRDAGDLDGARTAYAEGGKLGQSVGRPDVEGRSARLLAAVDNEAAAAADGDERQALAARAVQHATHAAELLADSYAWVEQAFALEERGDALRLRACNREAMADYALAVAGFLRGDDGSEAERLLRFFIPYIAEEDDIVTLIARAFDGRSDLQASSAWVEAMTAALSRCPGAAAPSVLGCLVRAFLPRQPGAFWFDCLIRCLLAVDHAHRSGNRKTLGSLLLLAILGFGRHRAFTVSELLTLTGVCASGSSNMMIRHHPGDDLNLVIHLGDTQRLLFTVRSELKKPEALFVALVIGSFLDAFADELSGILSPDLLEEGAAIDVHVFPEAVDSKAVAAFFREGLKDKPVATARIIAKEGEEPPVVVFARADAIEALTASKERGGELEIMLARFLDEVIFTTTGQSVDDAIFSSKIRDLLYSVFR